MNHYFKGLMAALTLANAVIFNPIPLQLIIMHGK